MTHPIYVPGDIVIDLDGDALRIESRMGDEEISYRVSYGPGRTWVRASTIDPEARMWFRITRRPDFPGDRRPWRVEADRVSPEGDRTWSRFRTHAEAIAYTETAIAR